jgi:hypothetical protein
LPDELSAEQVYLFRFYEMLGMSSRSDFTNAACQALISALTTTGQSDKVL